MSLKHTVSYSSSETFMQKHQLDPRSRFYAIPACDRQTDRQTHNDSDVLYTSFDVQIPARDGTLDSCLESLC